MLSRLATMSPRWHAGLGDPDAWGWGITVAYAIAGVLAVRALLRERTAPPGVREPRGRPVVWLIAALMLLGLGLNKQLDLQTLLTQAGKSLAHAQGWYEQRHLVQRAFLAGLAGAAVCGSALLAWSIRSQWRRYAPAVGGMAYLALFVVLRAAAFHHLDDQVLRRPSVELAAKGLEFAGIVLLGWAAWRAGTSSTAR